MKVLFLAACLCGVSAHVFAVPFSDLSFDDASKEAGRAKKIVLVDFYTTWCGPCKMLDKNTWTDPAVIQLLQDKTVSLRIDAEKEAALSKRYKIEAYPSVLLIKPDGTEMDRLVGYRDPKVFLADFNASLAGKDSITRAKEKVTAAGTRNANARMQLGVAMARKGRDAEALAEYLWCFDHGLENDPSFVGPRVSFLLMYIKNLAAHYPDARKALESRRDERQARLMKGSTDPEAAMDLIALNEALDQKEKNLAVYDSLSDGNPARATMSGELTEQFLEARRYADVLPVTSAASAFGEKVDQYKMVLNSVGTNNPVRDQIEGNFRKMTLAAGANYFEALVGLKRNEEARNLAAQILQFDSSQGTRETLAETAKRAGNAELSAEFSKK